jgi:hypothetical protein
MSSDEVDLESLLPDVWIAAHPEHLLQCHGAGVAAPGGMVSQDAYIPAATAPDSEQSRRFSRGYQLRTASPRFPSSTHGIIPFDYGTYAWLLTSPVSAKMVYL